ncbi:MAG: hypothetical protein M3O28_04495 [Actinomycetota bacterium]|nr:hypothetical protein [Actinomycetota bacterium]
MTGPAFALREAGTVGTVGTAARVARVGAEGVLVVRGLLDTAVDDDVGGTVTTGVVLSPEDGGTVATWIGLTSACSWDEPHDAVSASTDANASAPIPRLADLALPTQR